MEMHFWHKLGNRFKLTGDDKSLAKKFNLKMANYEGGFLKGAGWLVEPGFSRFKGDGGEGGIRVK